MEQEDAHVVEDGDSSCESLDDIGDDAKQDFHAQVASILEGLKELIETGFVWDLRHKDAMCRDIHCKPLWEVPDEDWSCDAGLQVLL